MAMTASTSDYAMLWSCVAALGLVAVGFFALVSCAERTILSIYAPEQLA
jgi:hypothetical protein